MTPFCTALARHARGGACAVGADLGLGACDHLLGPASTVVSTSTSETMRLGPPDIHPPAEARARAEQQRKWRWSRSARCLAVIAR